MQRFHGEELIPPRPNPKAGGPPPVGCPRLLIQYIRSYPPYWRPFLQPQPEDAPCRGDRDTQKYWNDPSHNARINQNTENQNIGTIPHTHNGHIKQKNTENQNC